MWVPNLPVTIISAVAASAGAACIFKDYYGGPPYERGVRAEGQTVVITGANTGIGKEAALEFANRGAKVFMACRDMEKCEEARREIVVDTNNKYVYCRPCDLASTASIREFVERFKSEEPHLHVLVNNAGVMHPPARVTRDGFETHLGVNHMGHFLLTNLLLDTLKASAPSRVVVVSCSAHRQGRVQRADPNLGVSASPSASASASASSASAEKFDARAAYAQSKLANVLFARELARRTLESNISVITVDPGLTDTDLTRNMAMSKSLTRYFIYPLFWPIMKTPKIGAQVILHAALDPKLSKCAGDYYVDMKPVEPSKEAQDYELALWLWRVSERWTKLEQGARQASAA